jgi:hypothetical protein
MENNQQPILIGNLGSSGVIMEGVVSDSLMPEGAISWAINVHFDRIGAATVRDGITIIGSQLVDNKSILGLHQFLDTGTGTNDRLIAGVDTTWKALVSGVWTNKRTGLTADKKARFTNFVDLVFGVNGTDAMNSWDGGAGNFGTTNCTSAPAAAFIDNFRTRVWAAKTSGNPSRLFYSTVADGSGAITWDTATQYIDVAPGDGEDITGIKKFGTSLYVFKNSFVYRIFSINQTEPDPVITIGTYSQESVVVTKDGMYWHHPTGIYKLQKGGASPIEISRPINDIIKNITKANYTEVAGWSDSDHVYFSVGNISVYGLTITNCVIRWTISTETWTIFSYASTLLVGSSYDDGTTISVTVGDNDGNIHTFNSGTTDNGTAIMFELETGWKNLTGLRSERKTISKLVALNENMSGANLGWRNGKMHRQEIQPIGEITSQESVFPRLKIEGNRIKLSIRGNSSNGSSVFQGWEVLDWSNDGVIY